VLRRGNRQETYLNNCIKFCKIVMKLGGGGVVPQCQENTDDDDDDEGIEIGKFQS
jgi:hypothetical protein